jgi:hypothetical protein
MQHRGIAISRLYSPLMQSSGMHAGKLNTTYMLMNCTDFFDGTVFAADSCFALH